MMTVEMIQARLGPLFPGLMGVRITELGSDRVAGTLEVRPDLCTSGGILDGGAVMAFADTLGAVGTVLNPPEGKRTTTIESSTKSIGAAPLGTTVNGESIAVHRCRTTVVWQTAIRLAEGKLCALVSQTQLILDR